MVYCTWHEPPVSCVLFGSSIILDWRGLCYFILARNVDFTGLHRRFASAKFELKCNKKALVAPLAGAWIEINVEGAVAVSDFSLLHSLFFMS